MTPFPVRSALKHFRNDFLVRVLKGTFRVIEANSPRFSR
jgi:hypothetical protein